MSEFEWFIFGVWVGTVVAFVVAAVARCFGNPEGEQP